MRYISLLILPVLFVCAAIGCSGKPARHSPPAVVASKPSSLKSDSSHTSNSIPNIMAAETKPQIEYVDPKTGKILWTANADQGVGQYGDGASDASAKFQHVNGTIYSDGKPAETFTAPLVTADVKNNIMIASGGVVIISLTQRDTSLRCDRMTWYSDKKELIGVGHAVFKKGGITQTMPSFQADTKMNKIVTPAPSLGKLSGHSVHTHIVHTHGAR